MQSFVIRGSVDFHLLFRSLDTFASLIPHFSEIKQPMTFIAHLLNISNSDLTLKKKLIKIKYHHEMLNCLKILFIQIILLIKISNFSHKEILVMTLMYKYGPWRVSAVFNLWINSLNFSFTHINLYHFPSVFLGS